MVLGRVKDVAATCLIAGATVCGGTASATDFAQIAYQADAAITQGLAGCGLEPVDAFDPRLPRPQVFSDLSYVNWERGLVAGHRYRQFYPFGFAGNAMTYLFPNGHTMGTISSYDFDGGITFSTDTGGTIAHATTYLTAWGRGFNLYCRSVPVGEADFLACVQGGFVDYVVQSLCRL